MHGFLDVILAKNFLVILYPVSILHLFVKNFNISFDYRIVFVANMYKIPLFLFLSHREMLPG